MVISYISTVVIPWQSWYHQKAIFIIEIDKDGLLQFVHNFMLSVRSLNSKEHILCYRPLTLGVFYRLSLATQAPTLPVCTDNGGAVPTAVMLLLGYFWASYATKGGTQH